MVMQGSYKTPHPKFTFHPPPVTLQEMPVLVHLGFVRVDTRPIKKVLLTTAAKLLASLTELQHEDIAGCVRSASEFIGETVHCLNEGIAQSKLPLPPSAGDDSGPHSRSTQLLSPLSPASRRRSSALSASPRSTRTLGSPRVPHREPSQLTGRQARGLATPDAALLASEASAATTELPGSPQALGGEAAPAHDPEERRAAMLAALQACKQARERAAAVQASITHAAETGWRAILE